jgi:hypothetical protein
MVPSPKSQAQTVIGTADVEASVKVTLSGAVPCVGADTKFATGGVLTIAETALAILLVLLAPLPSVMVSFTVYNPAEE